MTSCAALLALALMLAPARANPPKPPAADVYYLVGGDRVSGRTVSKGRRYFAVQTPYGSLRLPRAKILRIVWGDGREDILRSDEPPESPPPTPAPLPPVATLVVAVTGRSFWYAWDRREAVDPALRLQLWLDERELASYTDATLDPQDLPGATVNSFSFTPGEVRVAARDGVSAAPPQTRPGRVTLRLELPEELAVGAGRARRLRLAYQTNVGTPEEPAWRDVVKAAAAVNLVAGASTVLELTQDPGRMEFSGFGRKRMKHVESFGLGLVDVLDSPASQP